MIPVSDYFERGCAALDSEQFAEAIDYFTKAIRLSLGDVARVLLYRGVAFAAQGDYARAMADFNAALKQNPHLADAYNERGNLLRLHGNVERSIDDYTLALRIDAEHIEAYYNRALAHEALRHHREALTDLTQALTRNPKIIPAYEIRGRLRAKQGDYAGAIADLQYYLQIGGGQIYDNHSEVQSYILTLRLRRILQQLLSPFTR